MMKPCEGREPITAPAVGQVVSPEMAMRLAIQEGKKGAGFVAPNPLVGCTIVDREHRFQSVGYHRRVGQAHAEIDAIQQLRDKSVLKGGHVYVTLEPCAHQGRTPSCARTLVPFQPASVTYAVEDPNPLVAGQGAKILREAGVKAQALMEREDLSLEIRRDLVNASEDLAEIFLHNFRTGEPFVAVKVASSMDGQMAMASGESKWITGEEARQHTHLLRAQYDAVLIGRRTFELDDPSLNVRHPRYPDFVNRVVILDQEGKSLSSLQNSNLLKVRRPDEVIIVTAEGVKTENPAQVTVVSVPTSDSTEVRVSRLSINHTTKAFKSLGLTSLMIEGGASTYGAFFDAQKVSRLHAFMAPVILGGAYGLGWSSGFGMKTMSEKILLTRGERCLFGEDLYWTARVQYSGESAAD